MAEGINLVSIHQGWYWLGSIWSFLIRVFSVVAGIAVSIVILHKQLASDEKLTMRYERTKGQMKESKEQKEDRLKFVEDLENMADQNIAKRALEYALQISSADTGLISILTPSSKYITEALGEPLTSMVSLIPEKLESNLEKLKEGLLEIEDLHLQDGEFSPQSFWLIPIKSYDENYGYLILDIIDPSAEVQSDLQFLVDQLIQLMVKETDIDQIDDATSRSKEIAALLPPPYPSLLDLFIQGKCKEEKALDYLLQAARLLSKIHAEGKVHGLQPGDITVNQEEGRVFLGQRVDIFEHEKSIYEGFSAPELTSNAPTQESDVFCLGALLFAFYFRRLPRADAALSILVESIHPISETNIGLDYVLRKSLLPAPNHRFAGAEPFVQLLEHVRSRKNFEEPYANGKTSVDIGAEFNVGIHKGRNKGLNSIDNEDRIYWDYDENSGWTVLAIADGVSRAELGSGYEAANLFQNQVHSKWKNVINKDATPQDVIEAIFQSANQEIVEILNELAKGRDQSTPWQHTMSAAVCMALIYESNVYLGSLGDVRAYLVGDGFASRITADDTQIADAINDRSFNLRGLGNISEAELTDHIGKWEPGIDQEFQSIPITPHFRNVHLKTGDSLVLASDGLYRFARESDGLFDDLLVKVLGMTDTAQAAAFRLMTTANQYGGTDNISCIVYRTQS